MLIPVRREEFDLKLVGLEGEVEALAEFVSDSINLSVEALKNRDLDCLPTGHRPRRLH